MPEDFPDLFSCWIPCGKRCDSRMRVGRGVMRMLRWELGEVRWGISTMIETVARKFDVVHARRNMGGQSCEMPF